MIDIIRKNRNTGTSWALGAKAKSCVWGAPAGGDGPAHHIIISMQHSERQQGPGRWSSPEGIPYVSVFLGASCASRFSVSYYFFQSQGLRLHSNMVETGSGRDPVLFHRTRENPVGDLHSWGWTSCWRLLRCFVWEGADPQAVEQRKCRADCRVHHKSTSVSNHVCKSTHCICCMCPYKWIRN